MTSTSSSTLDVRKTYDIYLYNSICHYVTVSVGIYLFNLKTVSDILDHPVVLLP